MRNGAGTFAGAAVVRTLTLPLALAGGAAQSAAPLRLRAPRSAPSEAAVRAARELFRQAMSAQDAASTPDALAKLRRVADVRATPTVLFYIAYNEEKLGQLVVALAHMTEANKGLEAAAADKHAAQNADAVKLLPFARTELAQLDARVPHLRHRALAAAAAGASANGLSLTVDGATALPAETWAHLAVAAGPHHDPRAGARLPGRARRRRRRARTRDGRRAGDTVTKVVARGAPSGDGRTVPRRARERHVGDAAPRTLAPRSPPRRARSSSSGAASPRSSSPATTPPTARERAAPRPGRRRRARTRRRAPPSAPSTRSRSAAGSARQVSACSASCLWARPSSSAPAAASLAHRTRVSASFAATF